MMKIPTPNFSHITREDLNHIYEPSEDTFLLIDALELDAPRLLKSSINNCVEIGSGSGVVITAIGTCLGPGVLYYATDINSKACGITKETGLRNGVEITTICTDLMAGLPPSLGGSVDLLLFNPPYVVTTSGEVGRGELEYTWAGGERGREVMDRLFPTLDLWLSPRGVFYLLIVKENDADDIFSVLEGYGFKGEIIISRRAANERLSVLRFCRN